MAKIETLRPAPEAPPAPRPAASMNCQFGMWSSALVGPALLDSLRKLSPAAQMKNPSCSWSTPAAS